MKKGKQHGVYIYLGICFALLIFLIVIFLVTYTMNFAHIQLQTSSQDKSVDYERHYAFIVNDGDQEFWETAYQGALEEGESTGSYVEKLGSNLSKDYDEEQLMKIAVAEKVDGIMIEYDGTDKMTELIAEASASGIPVVTMLRDDASSSRISYVGISYYNLGQQYAEQILSVIDAKTEKKDSYKVMLLMNSDIPDSTRATLYSTIQDNLESTGENVGKIVLDPRPVDETGSFEAEETIRNIFLYENVLPDIIVCLDETCSACVYQALVDYNEVGNIEMVAYYTGGSILSGIDKDIIHSTAAVDTAQIGKNAVEALDEYIETGYSSDYYSIDTYIIDRDNISDYLQEADDEP